MEIVAKCSTCGREFVSEPRTYPAYDPFLRLDKYDQSRIREKCGGEIVPVKPHEA